MDAGLDSLASVERTKSFSGLSARSSLYYDAMIFVFQNYNLKLEDVEVGLAVRCAANIVNLPIQPRHRFEFKSIGEPKFFQWEEGFKGWVRECLVGKQTGKSEEWAEEVLALYMVAWMKEAKDIKDDFRGNFRRRVFLG